jgi:hypothetical protein
LVSHNLVIAVPWSCTMCGYKMLIDIYHQLGQLPQTPSGEVAVTTSGFPAGAS